MSDSKFATLLRGLSLWAMIFDVDHCLLPYNLGWHVVGHFRAAIRILRSRGIFNVLENGKTGLDCELTENGQLLKRLLWERMGPDPVHAAVVVDFLREQFKVETTVYEVIGQKLIEFQHVFSPFPPPLDDHEWMMRGETEGFGRLNVDGEESKPLLAMCGEKKIHLATVSSTALPILRFLLGSAGLLQHFPQSEAIMGSDAFVHDHQFKPSPVPWQRAITVLECLHGKRPADSAVAFVEDSERNLIEPVNEIPNSMGIFVARPHSCGHTSPSSKHPRIITVPDLHALRRLLRGIN